MRISDWSSDVCSSDLRVIAIDGRQIERFEQVSQAIFYRPDENADFTIKRGSETVHLSIKIGTRKEADRFGNEYRIGLIGIQSQPPALREVSLLEAPGVAVERTGTVLRLMVDTLGQIISGTRKSVVEGTGVSDSLKQGGA